MQRSIGGSSWRSALSRLSLGLGIVSLAVGMVVAGCGGSDDNNWSSSNNQGGNNQGGKEEVVVSTSKVPNPIVTGPIANGAAPGTAGGHREHNYPWLATMHNLAAVGYVEEEYFIEGKANTYTFPVVPEGAPAGTPVYNASNVGKAVPVENSGYPYKTRLLVRRPASADKFNGTVIAEWQNVTAGYDLDALWGSGFEHMIREGYVYVGISAQPVGVNQLKQWSASSSGFSGRYDSLNVGGVDSQGNTLSAADANALGNRISQDIFWQALQAIRFPGKNINPLGPLKAKKMIATGVSQSGSYLQRMINSMDPIYGNARTPDNAGPVDAYMVYIAGGYLNRNLAVPVWKVISETDVTGQVPSRPTGDDEKGNYRSWEMAGASHSGRRTSLNSRPLVTRDDWTLSGVDCTYPIHPRVPTHHVTNAVWNHLQKWMNDPKYSPPIMPPIQTTGTTIDRPAPPAEDRNSTGGVRLPEMQVPTAWDAGNGNTARVGGTGGTFCSLYGIYYPFTPAYMAQLYPTQKAYSDKVSAAITKSIADGIMLPADAEYTKFVADHIAFEAATLAQNSAAYSAAQDLIEITQFYLWTSGKDALDEHLTAAANILQDVARGDSAANDNTRMAAYNAARAGLGAYANSVEALRKSGKVSDASANELADGVQTVLNAIPK